MEESVARSSLAPVKSLGLVHPDGVDLLPGGVRGDRRFRMVDEDGRLFNNKRHEPMVTIRPVWDEDSRRIGHSFPDGTTVEDVVEIGQPIAVQLYGRPPPSRRVLGLWEDAIGSHVCR